MVLIYEMLENMIGSQYCGNTREVERDILGTFNSFLENKILVVLNEMKGQVGFKNSDAIKDLITNKKEPVRKMRSEVKQDLKSFCHYMIFTNNEFPIKIEHGDRRFFVIDSSSQKLPVKEYREKLAQNISNTKMLKGLYNILMKI